jgi:GntR family transcriptional regulator / MocR family aminotransferase
LVAPFIAARQLADRQSSGLIQAIMTAFMLEGRFARHLKRMRALYAERQAFLADLLARRLGGLIETDPNESGMYLVGWLPLGWNDRGVAEQLDAAGVTAPPLSALTLVTSRRPALVLGYSGYSEAAMTRAVDRMARALLPTTGLANLQKAELRSDQLVK